MAGFFSKFDFTSRAPISLLPKCNLCKLCDQAIHPKMPYSGLGRKRVLLVGEAPGAKEDEEGRQFVGKSGTYLRDVLDSINIDMRRDCWITNANICRPPNNTKPTDKQIEWCRPTLIKTVNEIQPDIVILLGDTAVKSLIGWLWKEDTGPVSRWVGWQIPCQKPNVWICPTYHPSYVIREKNQVLDMFFKHHLEQAFQLTEKPWEEEPNYIKQVQKIYDQKKVDAILQRIIDNNQPVAFDYETNMLKPDNKEGTIVCCSVSDGETTIAYPWVGEGIDATRRMLRSKVPKYIHNAKYEIRWSMQKLGTRIRNVDWDSMVNQHVADNRQGVCGLKFLSFVYLGQSSYDDAVKPYLKAKGGNEKNKVKEFPLDKLLQYCGMDSLLTWKITQIQKERMGVSEQSSSKN